MKEFEFFEHTADIGVHVYGATLPKLFENAARAMSAAMGELRQKESEVRSQKSVELEAESLEDLLHDWLAELLFEVETHHVLYDQFEFRELSAQKLKVDAAGGAIDFARSQPREEIKAVTYHALKVAQLPDGSWRATVIFDV